MKTRARLISYFGTPSHPHRFLTISHTSTKQIRPPAVEEVAAMKTGARLISYLAPAREKALLEALAAKKMTAIGE